MTARCRGSGPKRPDHTAIRLAGRRIAVGLAAGTAIVATAVTASAARSAVWVAVVFGIAAALLTGGLLIDVLRHR